MRKYFIIDDNTTRGAIVNFTALKAKTAEDAISDGWAAWDYLTRNEKKGRDAFYVISAEEDEEGAPDMNTSEGVIDIKEEWLKKERS